MACNNTNNTNIDQSQRNALISNQTFLLGKQMLIGTR